MDAFFEGVIRLLLFLGYLWLIGRMAEIRGCLAITGPSTRRSMPMRTGAPLTVPSVQKYSVQHTRCGTSFLLYVLVISIILFAPLTFSSVEPGWLALLLRLVSRLLLIPVVAGIAYEIIRFSAAHDDKPLMRLLIAPGLALQKMTTREPEDGMVEAAIAALAPVLAADGRELPSGSIVPGLAGALGADSDRGACGSRLSGARLTARYDRLRHSPQPVFDW